MRNNENLISSLTQEQRAKMKSYQFILWDTIQFLPELDFKAAFKNLKNLNIGSMNSKLTVSEMFDYCLRFKFSENEFFIAHLTEDKLNTKISEKN